MSRWTGAAGGRPGSGPVRRSLVIATVGVTALLTSALPLHGFGILMVLALAALDLLLLQATGGLAFRRSSRLDERQRRLRDLAYRRGFRWSGLAIVLLYVLWFVSDIVVTVVSATTSMFSIPPVAAVDIGIPGRIALAMAELLLMLPTLVIAWREDGGVDAEADADAAGGEIRRRPRWMAWLVLPGIAAAWLAAVVWLPPQSAPHGSFSASGGGPSGTTCQDFAGGTMVGAEFGAVVGLRANVCWDGTVAYVQGNPSLPIPASALRDYSTPGFTPPASWVNPAQPQLSGCGLDNTGDFAAVSPTTCSERIDAAGTLHYAVTARVSPLPFGIAARQVTVDLVVTRNGKVLEQP
ncbi:MAG: hypothetical protein ABSH07_06930 [Candidatus Dormibacteria bacterium]